MDAFEQHRMTALVFYPNESNILYELEAAITTDFLLVLQDSSTLSILLPRVPVPSTPFSQFMFELCHVEKTKINKKETGIGPFLTTLHKF